ncbi:MAG: chalcone isomerase family protein [Opitutales bacterium]
MRRHTFIVLLVVVALGATALSAQASEPDFPAQVTVEESEFDQLGTYRYVYRFFFPLYEAALYRSPGANAEEVLTAEAPFHLTFRYLRDIEKPIILKAATKMLEKNLSPEEQDEIAARVDDLNAAYTGVKEGDTSSLTYAPESGTTLRINGKSRATIPGQDFAQLYFRIWLGPEPLSKSLRDHLLGKK